MINKTTKKMFTQNNEHKVTILSDRIPGESEATQNKRIRELAKILAQEPTKSDEKKLEELLDNTLAAMESWKNECLLQGKNPSCISNFMCVDRKTRDILQNSYMIFGDMPDVLVSLKQINKALDPKEEFLVEEIPENDEDGIEIIP